MICLVGCFIVFVFFVVIPIFLNYSAKRQKEELNKEVHEYVNKITEACEPISFEKAKEIIEKEQNETNKNKNRK